MTNHQWALISENNSYIRDSFMRVWLFLATIVTAFPISTQSQTQLDDNNIFIGGRFLLANFQGACGENNLECNDTSKGMAIYTGYMLNPWLSVESEILDYGEPNATYSFGNISAQIYGIELSTKFHYPLFQHWSIYAGLGVALQSIDKNIEWTNSNPKNEYLTPVISMGWEYRLSRQWSLRGQYQFLDAIGGATTLYADSHIASIGIAYHFQDSNHLAGPSYKVEPVTREAFGKETIHFTSDSFTVTHDENLIRSINDIKSLAAYKITIIGHADSSGNESYNEALSLKRAQSVSQYIIQQGIEPESLKVIGRGEKIQLQITRHLKVEL